ncbi:hypothetical protein G5T42_09780 [Microbacterium sp. 4R-513]|uniref:hypothetical protein n=1 Tax=Microbacterium sp. 4R-513 TaxID=2567934 RepID=UPI0013E200E7|nr:hypothetical protein [Microbacterium sp. 4R-513]QIG39740.1 hypothetical protein G5T42_09780 [Microbacterium sp. 4R-513]
MQRRTTATKGISLKIRRIRSRVGVAALTGAFILGSVLAAVPASAAGKSDPADPVQQHVSQVGSQIPTGDPAPVLAGVAPQPSGGVTIAAAGYTVTCTPDAQNPHISSGAGGVIYKTRVSCLGTGAFPLQVTIRVRGALMFDSAAYSGDTSNGINWYAIRSSTESRIVQVNGVWNTFYTPQSGTPGAGSTGHYQGSSTVEITSPTGQKVGSDISQVVFIAP